MEKTKVFNVIILDKSGSMDYLREYAVNGVNETISGMKVSQNKYKDTQEHYILLNAFCGHGISCIYNNIKVNDAKKISMNDYIPCCSTPLFDAMGITLTKLEKKIDHLKDHMVFVTIITDGMENSSHEFDSKQIKELVSRLKEKGWNFTYMGTNQDVDAIADSLNISNRVAFSYDGDGLTQAYSEMKSQMNDEYMIREELRMMERNENRSYSNAERRALFERRRMEEQQRRRNKENEDNSFSTVEETGSSSEVEQEERVNDESGENNKNEKKKSFLRRLFK